MATPCLVALLLIGLMGQGAGSPDDRARLRSLAWRADRVVLVSVPEPGAGSVTLMESLWGMPGRPGNKVLLNGPGDWSLPGASSWPMALLFLQAGDPDKEKDPPWSVLPGGWRASQDGEAVYGPNPAGGVPRILAPEALRWDSLARRLRADLVTLGPLRVAFKLPAGADRDEALVEWLSRHARGLEHPESLWPAAATSALDVLYASSQPGTAWKAARLEGESSPGAVYRKGAAFASAGGISHLLDRLGSPAAIPFERVLALQALSGALREARGLDMPLLLRVETMLPVALEPAFMREAALVAMLAYLDGAGASRLEELRKPWGEPVSRWYALAVRGAERGLLAQALAVLGGVEVYARERGNPEGVVLLVEGLQAEGLRLRGWLAQPRVRVKFGYLPTVLLERLGTTGKTTLRREEPLKTVAQADPWSVGWSGVRPVFFELEMRGLEPGRWRLSVRAKRGEGTFWVSEPWYVDVRPANNPQGKLETEVLLVDPFKPGEKP